MRLSVFYALDPLVDRLQRSRVPRSLGVRLAIALVVGAAGIIAYQLQDDALIESVCDGVEEHQPIGRMRGE